MAALWDIAPYIVVTDRRFRGTYYTHREGHDTRRCENLKGHKIWTLKRNETFEVKNVVHEVGLQFSLKLGKLG
jgi:hypothetical protein